MGWHRWQPPCRFVKIHVILIMYCSVTIGWLLTKNCRPPFLVFLWAICFCHESFCSCCFCFLLWMFLFLFFLYFALMNFILPWKILFWYESGEPGTVVLLVPAILTEQLSSAKDLLYKVQLVIPNIQDIPSYLVCSGCHQSSRFNLSCLLTKLARRKIYLIWFNII